MTQPTPEEVRAELFRAIDNEDRLEIRKLNRVSLDREDKRTLDNWLEGAKLFSQQVHELRKYALNASVEYGKISVRAGFLLNGGAIITMLSFTAALFDKTDVGSVALNFASKLPWAFACYAGGLLFAAIAGAVGYMNWQYVYGSHLDEGHLLRLIQAGDSFAGLDKNKELAEFEKMDRRVKLTAWAGIVFGGISFLLFGIGTTLVIGASTVLGVR